MIDPDEVTEAVDHANHATTKAVEAVKEIDPAEAELGAFALGMIAVARQIAALRLTIVQQAEQRRKRC